ncbi:GAF domain-containing protein [uncultured Nostoc sp.]|uniref:GAF domain-containing protein n=1 Tax=uncultured Nostoc sp. TaxID=340711 RepID=UPI0035CB867C
MFKTTTQEIRQLLQADRVAIFSFNDDWSGNFVAESFAKGWTPLVGVEPAIADTYLQQTQGGRYLNNQTFTANDIYQAGLTNCHITLLEQFQAKAFATAPTGEGTEFLIEIPSGN